MLPNSKFKISVIMACYNASQFINEAIESVISQTYTNLELIIADDYSSDNTVEMAQKAASGDRRINVYALSQNNGPGAARNYAFERASGEWLAILDADDRFVGSKLEKQIELVNKASGNLVLVGCNSFEIDSQGHRLNIQKYPGKTSDLKKNLYRKKRFPPHSSLMYKAAAVRKLGGFNNRYLQAEDCDLWLRLSTLGPFGLVKEALVEYRLHEKNMTKSKVGFTQLEYGVAACVCHFIRMLNFPDPSVGPDNSKWFEFLHWISEELRDFRLVGLRRTKEELRNRVKDSQKLNRKLKILASFFINNPGSAMNIASEMLFGTPLPKKLAKKWVSKQLCTASHSFLS